MKGHRVAVVTVDDPVSDFPRWISPAGTIVPLIDIQEDRLTALYDAELRADGTRERDALFSDAYEAANLRTRHAWRAGYNNPRTPKQYPTDED